MATQLDHRDGPQQLAPCVLCHQPAVLRSPRGRPCHWTCALAWVNQQQDHEHGGQTA